MEQLPVKIKGGNHVSTCENYGVFVFLLFVVCLCASPKSTLKNGFSQFGAFLIVSAKSWVNHWATIGSITGPHVGSYF